MNNEGTDANSCAETVPSRPVRVLCNEDAKDEFVIAANSRAEAEEMIRRSRKPIRRTKFFTIKAD